MLSEFLAPDHFRLQAFNTGEAGLVGLQKQEFDLAILDIMLPGMNGIEVLKEIRKTSDIPVIMLSAVTASSFRHFLTMLNAQQAEPVPEPDHYLEKPVDHDQLIQLVRDTIG